MERYKRDMENGDQGGDMNSMGQDEFLEQMLSTINNPNCGWPPQGQNNPNPDPDLDPEHGHINAAKSLLMQHQQQLLLSHSADPALLHLPLSLATSVLSHHTDLGASQGADDAVMFNGFTGAHFDHPPQGGGNNYGGPGAMNHQDPGPAPAPTPTPASASTGGSSGVAPQRQRVRARRGQATDPHSIAERLRRERIAERMKGLQELVPNANKTDKASMLDEIIDYVKFLQLQVKVLSMSRLGGAGAVPSLGADMSSEKGGVRRSNNGNQTVSTNDNMTVTEHQVAKLMEEDMGSAMQYLQGKGLCLMPISLATAISTATCSRNPLPPTRPHEVNPSVINNNNNNNNNQVKSNEEAGARPSTSDPSAKDIKP